VKINSFKIFQKVIDTGSYSLAAEELGLTQPAVSMQIKSLEKFFDCQLIEKQGGELSLTSSGEIFYRNSREIIQKWEDTRLSISQLKTEPGGQINIGASTIPGVYFLPKKLIGFQKRFPGIKLNSRHGDSQEMIDCLKQEEVDLIVIGRLLSSNNYRAVPVAEDSLNLIVPKEYSLSQADNPGLTDILQEKFVMREKGSGTRKVMLEALEKKGYSLRDLKISCFLGSTEAIIAGVEAGLGISLVSRLAADKAEECGRIRTVELTGLDLQRVLYLVYKKGREREEPLGEVIDYLS